ncbi:MAG: hypothetical protein JWM91_3975 [Rhodospirillales bacterium]|nr:hypothetical protein [Rhodospirillales bacterium]
MRLACCVIALSVLVAPASRAGGLPADAGQIDVRDYGARGDGQHDDTEALLKAIAASGGDTGKVFWQDRPVYLPDGNYIVSGTLLKRYADGRFGSGLYLVGQSQAHTIIRLSDHAPGFGDPHQPRAVVFTTSKQIDGTPTSGGKDYPRLGEGNDAYMNFVQDLTIDVGHGNPGAIGIDYLANNIGAIRNVTLRAPSDSGAVGLSMSRKWPGPALIQNLTVLGFDLGIATAQTEYGLTLTHIRLSDQRTASIRNDQNVLSVRDLNIQGSAPAIINAGREGLVAIDGGEFHLPKDRTDVAAAFDNAGLIVVRNLQSDEHATKGAGSDAPNGIFQAGKPRKPFALPSWLPKPAESPASAATPLEHWVNAAHYGAGPDTTQAVTEGLRHAFASGAATIYLPHGTYAIDDAIDIPASVHRIVGMSSTIRVAANRLPGFSRTGGMLRIASGGEPVSIEGLAFDNTDQGAQLAVQVSGSRDVVLRDIVSAGVTLLDRKEGGGRVFLEDVCCGRMQIAGPHLVSAEQFDTEGGGIRILNKGSPLSILGLKTEGVSTIVDNLDGGRTDIFGGLVYMVRDPKGEAGPAFHNAGSFLSATFAEEVLQTGNQYRVYLEHDAAEAPVSLQASGFPERGLGHFVPQLIAEPKAPPTQ